MKRIIATTAMALMLSTSAYAAAGDSTMLKAYSSEQPGDIYASEFIGMRIYAAEDEWDTWDENARIQPNAEKEWDDIGEVNDVVLGKNGEVKAVILGVGGFVGIGEKDVAVPMDQIKVVHEEGGAEDYFLVIKANKEVLTEVAPYERADNNERVDNDQAASDPDETVVATKTNRSADETTDATRTGSVSRDASNDMGRPMLDRPMVTREGYIEAEPVELTADRLEGARVYGANDEDIGEIDRLILSEDGTVERVVIDVGGFLGMGEHPVGVTFDEIQVLRTEDGGDFRVYIDSTEEALEQQPAYKGKG